MTSTSLCQPLSSRFSASSMFSEFFSESEAKEIRNTFDPREQPALGKPGESCKTNLFFGFFFDGTKNNYIKAEAGKNHSNVARLYDCYPGLSVPGVLPKSTDWQHNPSRYSHFFKVYVPGVSSPFPQVHDTGEGKDEALGAAAGALGERRIIRALVQALNNVRRYFFKVPLFFQKELTETAAMTRSFSMRLVSTVLLSGAVILAVAGCEKPTVDVNIHGVNYKDDAFSYVVADPTRPESAAGGELIDAFAAGGTTCCFTLPRIWRPGIKVQISTTHWLPKLPDNSLPEVKETHVVEVPRYMDGKPGELWVLRTADGSIDLISSDFQPDHEKWPGKVKGWPVPSLEYQRGRWELLRKHKEIFVRNYIELLEELEKTPHIGTSAAWEYAKENEPQSIKGFSGPDDPRYALALRKDYTEGLARTRRDLDTYLETKP